MNETTNDGFNSSGWWIILILFFLFGGGYGGNNTQANMNDEFIKRDIFNTNANVSATAGMTQRDILENRYANQLAECNTQKEILLGNANLQKDILLGLANNNSSMAQCCCDIKTAIHSDGEATRALITQNKIEELQRDLNLAQIVASNQTQTQYILSQLGTYTPKS